MKVLKKHFILGRDFDNVKPMKLTELLEKAMNNPLYQASASFLLFLSLIFVIYDSEVTSMFLQISSWM